MVSGTFCDFKFRGENLDAHDWNGKSDPFFIIKVASDSPAPANIFALRKSGEITAPVPTTNAQGNKPAGGHKQVYVSEIIKADLYPIWKPFRLDFYELCRGDVNTELLIECYDWDMIGKSDFIGSSTVQMKDVINGWRRIELVNNGKPAGDLIVESKISISPFIYCDFQASAQHLDAKDSSGTSDPYFVFKIPNDINEKDTLLLSAQTMIYPSPHMVCGTQSHSPTNGYREVYESEVIMKTLYPEWEPFRISFYDLCRGDYDTKILIECYDYNQVFSNVLIGSAEVYVRTLLDSFGVVKIPLISPSKSPAGTFYLECIPSASNAFL